MDFKKRIKKAKTKLLKKLAKAKNHLEDQMYYLDNFIDSCRNIVKLTAKLTIVISCVLLTSFTAPVFHALYIENRVGSNTLYIRSPEKAKIQGSGTAFEVKAPSGKIYTLTNAHVCALGKDGVIMVQDKLNSGRLLPKRIIEVYKENDLCLVEGLEGYSGLELANNAEVGDMVWAIGYPLGEGLNISNGRIKEFGKVDVVDPEMDIKDCTGPEMHVEQYQLLFMDFEVCAITRQAEETDVPTYPGNSGSPLVNYYGNIEGVIFASNGDTHWGSSVPLTDVKKFLQPY